ncbi:MAG TPA: phosphate ABC transporter substrate-binding protein PstS [Nitrospiria bacterium]|jgi:phosphate transport system substrate-binding protein|nr:phosphate ABC transporter substrate-binding protein PstS [Nitrospiria bacterium]
MRILKEKLFGMKAVILVMVIGLAAPAWAETMLINAAGATFPYPIYSKWFDEYAKMHPDVHINYQSIGSGGGIKQASELTVDFGASDGPMTDEQLQKAKVFLLHFPTVMGADVPTYNIPGVTAELKFTGKNLADIFLGKITKWNDPAIAGINPGVNLPDKQIVVVHRSDGSGTTYIWVDYLSKVSPEWKEKVGVGTSVNWPVGLGGKGNEGVSGLVKQTPYSIGYVELIYAAQNKIDYGVVQNSAGKFVKASLESVTHAAAGAAKEMPADFRVSITNAPGPETYPIASFTWLLIPEKIDDPKKGKAITGFLKWMMTDGQKFAPGLLYAPLPKEVVAMEEKALGKIKY